MAHFPTSPNKFGEAIASWLPNHLELKPLTPQLLPAVVELDELCFGKLWSLDGYRRELESPNSDLLVLQQIDPATAAPQSIGIGCQWAILQEAHITIVAVHPDFQHRGFGQLLMYSLLLAARRRGLERATLEVGAFNRAALGLYQKFGFVVVGRRRGYYPQTGEDASIMWLGGLQHPEFEQTLVNWENYLRVRLLRPLKSKK